MLGDAFFMAETACCTASPCELELEPVESLCFGIPNNRTDFTPNSFAFKVSSTAISTDIWFMPGMGSIGVFTPVPLTTNIGYMNSEAERRFSLSISRNVGLRRNRLRLAY